jgi:hypothetical protein
MVRRPHPAVLFAGTTGILRAGMVPLVRRTPPSRLAGCLVAALLLLGAACAGPSLRRDVELAEGQRTTVQLVSSGGRLVLTLQNESAGLARDVYTNDSAAADPSRKVVPDEDLQALLDVFSELELFAQGSSFVPPDALDVLTVEQGGKRWALARRQRGVQASEKAFHDARDYFLSLYNSSVAYHGTGGQKPNFGGETLRAKNSGQAARNRLEAARRGQR